MPSSNNIIITVVHCWSSPRSRSTALLYSFESRRSDSIAIDEPLYRQWLIDKGDAVSRPYKDKFLRSDDDSNDDDDDDGNSKKWKRERQSLSQRINSSVACLLDKHKKTTTTTSGGSSSRSGGVIFIKHMAKHSHLYDFEQDRERTLSSSSSSSPPSKSSSSNGVELRHVHVLLIRDPVAVLSSWNNDVNNHGGAYTPDEVGIVSLMEIYSSVTSRRSNSINNVVIVDSDSLVNDVEGELKALCEGIGIDYSEEMLTWDSGEHECDGPWAPWWYKDVHKSTGWTKKTTTTTTTKSPYGLRTIDPRLLPALRLSLVVYNYLKSLYDEQTKTTTLLGDGGKIYEDERNKDLLVWVGAPGKGRLMPREMAGLSPWDSSVQGGDAAWEGLRIYRGKILSLERHLKRLFRSAKALAFENVHTKEEVMEAIFATLAANGMRDGAHIRLTLTRGVKCTSSMNPKFNIYGTTLIVLPEWKPTEGATTYDNTSGITLITATNRRNPPSCVDSKIHHNNMINNILPKIQANLANAADAIMLDLDGFVSETNATNIFMVDDNGTLVTPHADHCLPGITRETVIELAKSDELNLNVEVRRVSLAEFHAAEEVFTTGTMGELTPVTMIDGRVIGTGRRGVVTERLQRVYKSLPEREGWATEIPKFE